MGWTSAEWKQALSAQRPKISMLATVLTVSSYAISRAYIDITMIISCVATYFVVATCMVWNNWVDRKHDTAFGNSFANRQGHRYLTYAVCMWGVTGVLLSVLACYSWKASLVLAGICVAGLVYTYARHLFLLSELMVGICLTSTIFLPATQGYPGLYWYIYLAVNVYQLYRENVKNMLHPFADVGYKKTIAVLFGNYTSGLVAQYMLAFSVFLTLLVTAQLKNPLTVVIQLLGLLLITVAGAYITSNHFAKAKQVIDYGSLIFALGPLASTPTHQSSPIALCATGVVQPELDQQSGFPYWEPATVKQPPWTWPVMISLLVLVNSFVRTVTGQASTLRIFLPGTWQEALGGACVLGVLFLYLFWRKELAPALDESDAKLSHGKRIVLRMASGLLLSAGCIIFSGLLGHSVWAPVAMMLVGIGATIWNPRGCWVMKQRGFQLGVVMGLFLVGGIEYALIHFFQAYIPTVVFYYLWTWSTSPPPPDRDNNKLGSASAEAEPFCFNPAFFLWTCPTRAPLCFRVCRIFSYPSQVLVPTSGGWILDKF